MLQINFCVAITKWNFVCNLVVQKPHRILPNRCKSGSHQTGGKPRIPPGPGPPKNTLISNAPHPPERVRKSAPTEFITNRVRFAQALHRNAQALHRPCTCRAQAVHQKVVKKHAFFGQKNTVFSSFFDEICMSFLTWVTDLRCAYSMHLLPPWQDRTKSFIRWSYTHESKIIYTNLL